MNSEKDNISQIKEKLQLSEKHFEEGYNTNDIGRIKEYYGENVFKTKTKFSALKIFFKQFRNFIVMFLAIGAIISLVANENINFWIILFVILFVIILGFMQEYRAEAALSALKQFIKPQTKVYRDGGIVSIEVRDLVLGDIILLEAGDKVPADVYIFDSIDLRADESLLTGESLPVEKKENEEVFSGTQIVAGKTRAVVKGIGMDTELGKIANAVQTSDSETPLQKKINNLSKILAVTGLCASGVILIIGIATNSFSTELFIVALTLAVATMPEGLPLTLTITLTFGMRRLAEKKALVRKLLGVETLGSTTVICTDKTGTLTKNEMTVQKIYSAGEFFDIGGSGYEPKGKILQNGASINIADKKVLYRLLEASTLCNNSSLTTDEKGEYGVVGDPTEGSLLVVAQKAGIDTYKLSKENKRSKEVLFTSERKMMSTINEAGGERFVFSKGAFEVIFSKSVKIAYEGQEIEINQEISDDLSRINKNFSSQAFRVLAVAYKRITAESEGLKEAEIESDLVFLGLIAMIDPPREETKEAILACRNAGIKVIMITGDNQNTAKAIAHSIGLGKERPLYQSDDQSIERFVSDGVIIGSELNDISDEELTKLVDHVYIYARTKPEQKLRIVNSLQQKGHIVAMTGDGVNDAPALKKADIGIAMGQKGTDVAKESAIMILQDDNFATIVEAIRQGRGIFENIEKFIVYLISQNFNEIFLIIMGSLVFGFEYLPLTAIMILFLNTFDEVLPSLSLGFDEYRYDLMSDPPLKPNRPILNKRNLFLVLSTAIFLSTIIFASFATRNPKENLDTSQSIAFLGIAMIISFTPFAYRSLKRSTFVKNPLSNKLMVFGMIFSLATALGVAVIPYFRNIIGISVLDPIEWIVPVLIGILGFIWIEFMKFVIRGGD